MPSAPWTSDKNKESASSWLSGNDEQQSANSQWLDWRAALEPRTLLVASLMTGAVFSGRYVYRSFLMRFTGVKSIDESFWRRRSLLGKVTSVGDGDGFRLYHTPGGRLAGWGLWRTIPSGKALKDNTLSIRLAGVDAPESAHFGQPGQPGGPEALSWLTSYVLHKRVRAYIHRRDQYDRAIATCFVYRWGGIWRKDVGLEMLRKGMATVYEAKTGLEFGGKEPQYRKAESLARLLRRVIWAQKGAESPRQFKDRQKGTDKHA